MAGKGRPAASDVARVAESLREAICSGAIAPGEQISTGAPGWPWGLNGATARSALAVVRGQGLAYWHRNWYYAAPGGPPQPGVSARLGRLLAAARAASGVTVPMLAARVVDGNGPWGPGGREHMIGLRVAAITAAEAGAWQPRRAWRHIDAALHAGGTLLHVHDNLYAGQHPLAGASSHGKGYVP
jgi:hypothetical protein